jgi:hypothetical protein
VSSPYDLTTLANVKAWLAITNTNSDTIIGGLITAVSRGIYSNMGRASILPRTFNERYDGQGNQRFYLRNWPVISISSLSNWGVTIPQGTPPGLNGPAINGYLIQPWDGTPPGEPQAIDVYGWGVNNSFFGASYRYSYGRQNVAVTYTAGYQVTGEAWNVPATGPYTVTPLAPYGPWATDQGVTYANGTALTLVAGTPAKGQYAQAAGVYTFAAADDGAAILVSYGFIPQDLVDVATELVAERYSYRTRIGEVSKSLGGQETMSYYTGQMPRALDLLLQPYRSVYIPP